jgi:glucosamine--fructose-6-phosphate aminotransferase (isomerizing)
VGPKTGLIALSQSGETADLLAALREQAAQYASLIGICNRIDATLSRLVDHCYYLQIGYERSVAATKSFTAQVALLCLILLPDQERLLLQQEALLWEQQASRLLEEQHIERWAKILSSYQALMILGRGPFCGLAQEAALKIKELTYTHVHSLPLAELKHGSLAVIDAQCPILLFLARDSFVQKNLVAVHEILARSGRLFIIAQEGVPLSELQGKAEILVVPAIKNLMLQILLFSLPVQLLAGLWAQNRGLNIDKPRHLAKSVTVE